LPATATVIGVIVLTQIPAPIEILGVALVVTGVAVHQQRRQTHHPSITTSGHGEFCGQRASATTSSERTSAKRPQPRPGVAAASP